MKTAIAPFVLAAVLLSASTAHAGTCSLELESGVFGKWQGPCKDDKAYGEGEAAAPGGSTYAGSALNGKRHGFGTANDADGGYYRGEFRDGVPHGAGTVRGADGRHYRVEYRHGERQGEGIPVAGVAADDPWADDAEAGVRKAASGKDPWVPDRADEADPWAPEPGKPGSAAAPSRRAAMPAVDDREEGDGAYRTALAALGGRTGAARPRARNDDYTGKLAALEKLEADRRAAEITREAERRAAEERRRREEGQARERIARQREEERRRAREASRSYSSPPSYSSRSSGGSISSGLFGSGSSGSGGLFNPQSGIQALRDIDARRKAMQRQHAERVRRQQEEFRRQKEAARRQQELQRQRQRQQAASDRQRQQQGQAEARRQQDEARRRQDEARQQRQIQERQRAEVRKQQAALQQRQADARRRQEEQKRQQALARKRQAANAAVAAHCLQRRQLKGGFNVSDVEIRNACSHPIEVGGRLQGHVIQGELSIQGDLFSVREYGPDDTASRAMVPHGVGGRVSQEGPHRSIHRLHETLHALLHLADREQLCVLRLSRCLADKRDWLARVNTGNGDGHDGRW